MTEVKDLTTEQLEERSVFLAQVFPNAFLQTWECNKFKEKLGWKTSEYFFDPPGTSLKIKLPFLNTACENCDLTLQLRLSQRKAFFRKLLGPSGRLLSI
jgi:hypothetical protein